MALQNTCFVIDDDADDQEIFELALKGVDKDINCVFANDGVEALEKLNTEPEFVPNYIFLDLNMTRMSGKLCLEAIKKIERLSHIPVVIYSTSSEPHDLSETRSLGATDYIVKPESITLLIESLASLIKK